MKNDDLSVNQEIDSEEISSDDNEDTMKNRYLTFQVGREEYGIEILYVKEIIGLQKITEIPDVMDFIKGVINLRGQVIPLIDMRLRFHMEEKPYEDRTCIVVVEVNAMMLGLVVDKVNEVAEISEEKVSTPPKLTKNSREYIRGMAKVEENVKLILDVDKLFFEDDIKQSLNLI